MMGAGVPAGASRAPQAVNSNPGTPASAMVGVSGSVGRRCASATPRITRRWSARKGSGVGRAVNMTGIWSATTAFSAGVVPRNGTCCSLMSAARISSSIAMCCGLPWPPEAKSIAPGFGLCLRHELGERGGVQRWAGDQGPVDADELDDRDEGGARVVAGVRAHVGQHGDDAVVDREEGIAVGRSVSAGAHAEQAGGAGLVVHEQAATQGATHLIGHDAGHDVHRAAGGERLQEADRAGGVVLRLDWRRRERQHRSQ